MDTPSEDIRAAFVAAYPLYVASLLTSRGIEVDETIADSVIEGASVLDGLLTSLLDAEPGEQAQSPLELFREALRPVSRAMDTNGVPPVRRDPGKKLAVPWDHHDLSPVSPRALGDGAHEAHLRWGVAKAAAMGAVPLRNAPSRPVVWIHAASADSAILRSVVGGLGYDGSEHLGDDRPVFALIDLDTDDSDDALRLARERQLRMVVFAHEIDDLRAAGLAAAGAWKVASRDDVVHRLGTLVPVIG